MNKNIGEKGITYKKKTSIIIFIAVILLLMVVIFGPKSLDILLIPLIPILYFLPAIIASEKKHPSTNSIFVLNLFLGWTFLGWVISLIWALNSQNIVILEKTNQKNNYADLETLAQLKEKGIISEEEYLKKKNEILNQ